MRHWRIIVHISFCPIIFTSSFIHVLISSFLIGVFQGHIPSLSERELTVLYLPCGPQRFHASFQIQVAHFEPDTIHLHGEGVFPRISLDLPRSQDPESHYQSLVKQAKEAMSKESRKKKKEVSVRRTSVFEESGAVLKVMLFFWIVSFCETSSLDMINTSLLLQGSDAIKRKSTQSKMQLMHRQRRNNMVD